MRAYLHVPGPDGGRRHAVETTVVLGRESDCDLLVDHPTVSRRHAALEWTGAAWRVRDLGSGNGTFVDGERVTERVLGPRAALRLGELELAFDAVADEDVSSATFRLRQTLTVKPSRRYRPVALTVTILASVLFLVAATLYERGCTAGGRAKRTPSAARP